VTTMQLTLAVSMPSVPEFTVKQVDRSYDAPTTYSTNPYTGETTTNPGHRVQNLTIDITIKNQPFTPSTVNGNITELFYNVETKNPNDNWSSLDSDSRNRFLVRASTSESTIVTFIMGYDGWYASVGSQVDIRVQAVIGYKYLIGSPNGGPIPIGTGFKLVSASNWADTQTVTVGNGEVTTNQPTSQPTQNPTTATTQNNTDAPTQPEVASGLAWKDIVIVAAFAVIAALAAALVLTRRKKQ
jgi:hypothetical protein